MKFLDKLKILPKYLKAKYYTKKANKLLQKGDIKRAKDYYEKLEKMGFVNYMIYHNLGSIYFQFGNLEKAKKYFEKSIDLNNENVVTYSTLSEIYLRERKWDKAEKVIDKALEIEPFNYFLKKRKKRVFNKEWRKSYVDSLEETEKGLKAKKEGDIDKAKEHLKKAVQLNNKNSTASFVYGTMLFNEEKYEEGIKHVSMAVEFSQNKRYSAVLSSMQKKLNEIKKKK